MEPSSYSEDRDRRVYQEQAAFHDVFRERHQLDQVDDSADRERLEAMLAGGPTYEARDGRPYLNRYSASSNVESVQIPNGLLATRTRGSGQGWF